jgi:hypothetical protein
MVSFLFIIYEKYLDKGARWYNTTYITIAASVLLLYESRTKERSPTSTLALIETAIEILDVMDESIVARNAAEVIRHFVRELNTVPIVTSDYSTQDATSMSNVQQAPTPGPWSSLDVSHCKFHVQHVTDIYLAWVEWLRILGLSSW